MADEATAAEQTSPALGEMVNSVLIQTLALETIGDALQEKAQLSGAVLDAVSAINAVDGIGQAERDALISQVMALSTVAPHQMIEAIGRLQHLAADARAGNIESPRNRELLIEMLVESENAYAEARYEAALTALETQEYRQAVLRMQDLLEKENWTDEDRIEFVELANGITDSNRVLPRELVEGLANTDAARRAEAIMRDNPLLAGAVQAERFALKEDFERRAAEFEARVRAGEQLTPAEAEQYQIARAVADGVILPEAAVGATSLEEVRTRSAELTTEELKDDAIRNMPDQVRTRLQRLSRNGGGDGSTEDGLDRAIERSYEIYTDPNGDSRRQAAMAELSRVTSITNPAERAEAMANMSEDAAALGVTMYLTSTVALDIIAEEIAQGRDLTPEQLVERMQRDPRGRSLGNVPTDVLMGFAEDAIQSSENPAFRQAALNRDTPGGQEEFQQQMQLAKRSLVSSTISRVMNDMTRSAAGSVLSGAAGPSQSGANADENRRDILIDALRNNGQTGYADRLEGFGSEEAINARLAELIDPANEIRLQAAINALNSGITTGPAGEDAAVLMYGGLNLRLTSLETIGSIIESGANPDTDPVLNKNMSMNSRVEALIERMVAETPEMEAWSNDPNFRNAVRESIRLADENPEMLNNARAMAEATAQIRMQIENNVTEASRALRRAGRGGSNTVDVGERVRARVDGISFIELEFEDVESILQQNLGSFAEGKSAEEMIQILEDSGFIREYDGRDNGRNRRHWMDNNEQGEAFDRWNDDSRARIDTDGDRQIDGLEAFDALQIAGFVSQLGERDQQRLADAAQALGDVSGQAGLAKHDINGDGRLDKFEVARVMLNNGITYIDNVDTAAELRQLLPQAASAEELGR